MNRSTQLGFVRHALLCAVAVLFISNMQKRLVAEMIGIGYLKKGTLTIVAVDLQRNPQTAASFVELVGYRRKLN
jgi:hypothetical protein